MIHKHKTGINGFDIWVGEELPSGNYLILGPPKVGKTIFVNQIAYLSALAKRPVVYVTLDGSPENIKWRMKEFNWDVEPFEKGNLFQFVDGFTFWYAYPQKRSNEFSVESLTNISKLLSVIVEAHNKTGSNGIIILNSLSTLLEHAEFQKSYSFMTGLKALAEERNCLGFAVLTSGMHPEMQINAFKHIVDGVIEMQFQTEKEKTTRKIRFIGLGTRLNLLNWREFTITPDGIKLAPQMNEPQQRKNIQNSNPTPKKPNSTLHS
ncbi:MAG: ATPase domain-containing protein [Candidatus Jordarchaeaceae archaeon]